MSETAWEFNHIHRALRVAARLHPSCILVHLDDGKFILHFPIAAPLEQITSFLAMLGLVEIGLFLNYFKHFVLLGY